MPVVWVGRRAVDLRRHPRPWAAAPVRLRAGALGAQVPVRDLRVSPDHAVRVDGMLVPAMALVDDEWVQQERWCRAVEYFHVELPSHAVLIADGAPAESWLDEGNRHQFDNCGVILALHADFAASVPRDARCLPRVTDPDALARIRLSVALRRAAGAPAVTGAASRARG